MKLSPFKIILILLGIAILCYLTWQKIKVDMMLYGDNFWYMVTGGCVLFLISILMMLYSEK